MKLKPILTEKSLNLARSGKYSFWVDKNLLKSQIKKILGEVFGVHVTSVRTIKYKGGIRINLRRRKIKIPERKKAVVTLKEGEKIDLFETKEEKSDK